MRMSLPKRRGESRSEVTFTPRATQCRAIYPRIQDMGLTEPLTKRVTSSQCKPLKLCVLAGMAVRRQSPVDIEETPNRVMRVLLKFDFCFRYKHIFPPGLNCR